MAPGWRDAALSYANKAYGLGLSVVAPNRIRASRAAALGPNLHRLATERAVRN
jgi:hypothetical protein